MGLLLRFPFSSFILPLVLVLNLVFVCNGGTTSSFVRKQKAFDMPLDSDVFYVPSGYNAPQQVHITQGDHVGKAVIVSWVTQDEPGSNAVRYWSENSEQKKLAKGKIVTYRFFNYTSGFIHHTTIRNLEYNTKYYYEVGLGNTTRQFWFITPPEVGRDVPYTFGLIGDLGQSFDSNRTLSHYELNPSKGQTVLFVGDLSYADNYPNHDNVRWDTWGRFVERSTAYQPWIWTVGNHEIDFVPEIGETKPFKPYLHRYHTPYKASQSTSPFWYSIKRASAYIIVLASYSAYGKYTPQYQWLEEELPKVNRTETPWLIVLMHAPWYNSYNYHFMEGENMRVMFEPWFVKYKVDVVFAGHVHAYERTGETKPFKPYLHRYHTPYKASQSTSPFWYSIKRASAYIIVLASYSAYGKYTPQYQWLEEELPKVNRTETPWLIVLMHAPWYNSYNYHFMEGETMRVMFEPWFVKYKVDVVFAGHVHAYERTERVSNIAYNVVNGICTPIKDQSAPVYITIGDGGNLGGLATNMTVPQPKYSEFREASYGHATFDIKNRTNAYFSWHRNQDGDAVNADSLWFFNRFWHPVDDSTSQISH